MRPSRTGSQRSDRSTGMCSTSSRESPYKVRESGRLKWCCVLPHDPLVQLERHGLAIFETANDQASAAWSSGPLRRARQYDWSVGGVVGIGSRTNHVPIRVATQWQQLNEIEPD